MSRLARVEEGLLVLELPVAGIAGRAAGERELEKRIKERWPAGPSVVWSFTPFFSRMSELFPGAKWIFDAVDDWREQGQHDAKKEELSDHYVRIRENADTIFTVSSSLRNELFEKRKNAHWIPNGVDTSHFSAKNENTFPTALANLPKPVLGYVGIIQERVDANMLMETARAFPDASVALIGPVWRKDAAFKALEAEPNVHVLGPVSYDDVPGAISAFDVALIPHKVDAFTKTMNPLKLYEYLAVGKPVVTTPVAGLQGFEAGIRQAKTPEAFVEAVRESLKNPPEPQAQRGLVEGHGWDDRVEKMLKAAGME